MMSLSVVNIWSHAIFSYNFVLLSYVQNLQKKKNSSLISVLEILGDFWGAVSFLVLSRYPLEVLWDAICFVAQSVCIV